MADPECSAALDATSNNLGQLNDKTARPGDDQKAAKNHKQGNIGDRNIREDAENAFVIIKRSEQDIV